MTKHTTIFFRNLNKIYKTISYSHSVYRKFTPYKLHHPNGATGLKGLASASDALNGLIACSWFFFTKSMRMHGHGKKAT